MITFQSFIFFTRTFLKVAGAAAPDNIRYISRSTYIDCICLGEVRNGSILDPRYNQAILFVVFQLAYISTHFSI